MTKEDQILESKDSRGKTPTLQLTLLYKINVLLCLTPTSKRRCANILTMKCKYGQAE